ncbi:MAG: hypothetical protein WCO44_15795 [Bacteroidota bacterium]
MTIQKSKIRKSGEMIPHFTAAVVIFLKGISKVNDIGHNWPFFAALCLIGILLFIFPIFHTAIEKRSPKAVIGVNFFEAAIMFVLSVSSFMHHQSWVPYTWLVAAVFFLISGLLRLRKEKSK